MTTKNKRTTALDFIRDNSRVIRSMVANPISAQEKKFSDDYQEERFEQRIGNNGTLFILFDMGKHGWELYFVSGSIEITKTLDQFAKRTGAELPADLS